MDDPQPDDKPRPPEPNARATPSHETFQQMVSMFGGRNPRTTLPTRGSTGDPELDSVGKLAFLKLYIKQVRATYEAAIAKGMADAIIFLVDCEDDVGGRLAELWCGAETVEAQIAARKRGEKPGRTVVIVRPVPYPAAEEMVRFDFPYLREIFPEPPNAGEVCVVIVGLGGAASLFVPIKEEEGNKPRPAM